MQKAHMSFYYSHYYPHDLYTNIVWYRLHSQQSHSIIIFISIVGCYWGSELGTGSGSRTVFPRLDSNIFTLLHPIPHILYYSGVNWFELNWIGLWMWIWIQSQFLL